MSGASQLIPGLREIGNTDLDHRPILRNPDGSVSTMSTASFGTDKGETLIPTVVNGKRLSNDQAMAEYQRTGKHMGIFDTPEDADRYSQSMHDVIASQMFPGPQAAPAPASAGVKPVIPPPSPHQAEFERLTAPPISGPLAHTSANTGVPGFQQIHNPFLRTLAGIGDAFGSTALPRLTQFVPGTTAYHNRLVGNEAGAVKEEQAGAKNAAEVSKEGAQTRLANQQAETMAEEGKRAPKGNYIAVGDGLFNAETGKWEREPTDKKLSEVIEIDPDKGVALGLKPNAEGKYVVPYSAAGELLRPQPQKTPTNEMEKFFFDNPKATAEDWEKFKKDHPAATKFTAEESALLRSVGGDPDKPETLTFPVMKKYEDLKKEKISVGADHGVTMIDPTTHKLVRVEPGGAVPEGALTPTQAGAQNAPTMQQRNVAGQAQLVHEQMPEVIQNIDRMKDKLGPIAGRWNDFMQGKIGTENPDFAALRADLLMMSSAVALMHARGRLPENLREEFDHAINAPKQTADNLKAVLGKIDQWTTKSMQLGGKKAETPTAGAARKYNRATGKLE